MCARCVHALGRVQGLVVAGRFWCSYARVSRSPVTAAAPPPLAGQTGAQAGAGGAGRRRRVRPGVCARGIERVRVLLGGGGSVLTFFRLSLSLSLSLSLVFVYYSYMYSLFCSLFPSLLSSLLSISMTIKNGIEIIGL